MSEEEVYQKRDLILTEIHNDVKHLVKNFDAHVSEDKKVQEELKKQVDWNSKILYMGLGALAILNVGIRFILK